MKKILSIVLLLGLMVGMAEAPVLSYYTLLARVTVYSVYQKGESKINHKGRKIINNLGVAVPKGTLKDGTLIEILEYGIKRTVDDRIPKRSVRKHERVAAKKGIDIDIVIDLRYNNIKTKKGLYKKDLGYQMVRVYD